MKKLKMSNRNALGLKVPRKLASDSDGDGYPDPVDCEPNNPNKQGKVGDWLRKKGDQFKEDRAVRQKANRERKVAVRDARLKAREEAAVKFTKEREAYRGKRKLTRYKQARPLKRPSQGPMGKPPSMFGGPSLMNPFGSLPQEKGDKPKQKKRKKKKSTSKKGKKRKKR